MPIYTVKLPMAKVEGLHVIVLYKGYLTTELAFTCTY